MPIAINGSGTLTGLSVGGLENGIITPAELSTGAPSWDAQYNLTNVASINPQQKLEALGLTVAELRGLLNQPQGGPGQ